MTPASNQELYSLLPVGFRIDSRLGPVYDRVPAAADDLTCIRGLETREAALLNRTGVYFIAQIALWNDAHIKTFARELGTPSSTIVQQQWVSQAKQLCTPASDSSEDLSHYRPAPLLRTAVLVCCGLLIGCLLVYWLSQHKRTPLHGILAADITAIRVPTEARLLTVKVKPGQEVFTGDELVRLEKTEHTKMISLQEERVSDLQRQLRQAEAQAALDLAWRTRELERELSDVRTQAHLIREAQVATKTAPLRTAALPSLLQHKLDPRTSLTQIVSSTRSLTVARRPARPNSMLFISGTSGETSSSARTSAPVRTVSAPTATNAPVTEPVPENLLAVEAHSVAMRLTRLEELRQVLPEQVRQAAGVESLRMQYDEAMQRLNSMKTLSREMPVICPAYGKVGQIRFAPGDIMPAGEIMLRILHANRRYVMVNVPTSKVTEVQPGTIVDLNFPGDVKCRGRVTDLPMLAKSAGPGTPNFVSVRVEPTGRHWPDIPIGSQIGVTVNSALR